MDPAAISRYFAGMRLLPVKYIAPLCEAISRLWPGGAPAESLPPELHKWTGRFGLIPSDRLSQALIAWLMEDMEQEEALRVKERQAKRKPYERKAASNEVAAESSKRGSVAKDFAAKLSLLMDTAGVSGSQLASALHVDPTLVYKYRAGSRLPTRRGNTVQIIADTIARYIRSDEQREMIITAAGYAEADIAPEEFSAFIEAYLESISGGAPMPANTTDIKEIINNEE